ncbi:MAG: hypothetical protein QHG97_02135 [Methanolinea sp.]|jgi:hypothetical protein|nr:hypothetical protein [Methanolinea sp.]
MANSDFVEAEKKFQDIQNKYASGELTWDVYTKEVSTLRISDDRGFWWQLNPKDGSWLKWDGKAWVPGDPFQKSDQFSKKRSGQESSLATVKFIKTLASGMKKSIARSIPLMLASMAAVWGIHTLLTWMVKKDTIGGNPHPLIASILILPGHEAAGLLFWGLLVGLIISFINKVRHDQLPATKEKLRTTPAFIRQSFDKTGFQGLLIFLLGISLALLFAGLVANILVSLQCILLFVNTLIAQREGMMALFLQAIGSDIARGLHFPGNPGNSSIWFSAAGMTGGMGGFLVSLFTSPAQFMIVLLIGILVLTCVSIIVLSCSKNHHIETGGG